MFSYYGARALIFFSRMLPKNGVYYVSDRLMTLFFWIDKKRREQTIDNLAKAYTQKSPKDIANMAKQSYVELGKTASECLLIHTDRLSPSSVVANAEEVVKKIHQISSDAENGVIYITAHYSNWELLCHFFGENDMPLLGIVKKSKNSRIEDGISTPFRNKFGNTSVSHKKSMMAIAKALKRGKSVVMAIDQWVRPPNVVQVDFFGRRTNAVKSVATLKNKLNPKIVPLFIQRVQGGFEIVVGDSIEVAADEQEMTQAYYDAIERQISRNPVQWMWIHNRWKRLNI